tara:strand:- start:99 stop:653 length:555 start_codon:yes stop_codon:yes gene_type:complete
MKDSSIALGIAGAVTILAGISLYYGSSYLGHGDIGYNHGKRYSYGHSSFSYGHEKKHSVEHYGGNHSYGSELYYILRFKEQLVLTEDQTTQINNLIFEFEKKKIDFNKNHKIANMEIEREMNLEILNESKVKELANKIGNLKRKNIEDKFEVRLKIIRLLSIEQKKKVKQIHAKSSEGSTWKIE